MTPPAIGRITWIGWQPSADPGDDKQHFTATVVFDSPPDWPNNVIWQAWPVMLFPQQPAPAAETST